MKTEQLVREEIVRLEKLILSSSTKMNIREQSVNKRNALEWVLEDLIPKVEKRLKDAGIITDSRTEAETE